MLNHRTYRAIAPGERSSISPAPMIPVSSTGPRELEIGDADQERNVSYDQVKALIARARSLLEEADDSIAVGHLQDAIDTLDGKPCRQVERDTLVQSELRHRFRNIIAITQSLVTQTLRPGVPMDDARERLTQRLVAMGTAVDLLLGAEWQPSALDTIVRASLAHFGDDHKRIHCQGPEVMIGSTAVISLTLALHELEANAIKYGALSALGGQVALTWSLVGLEDEPKLWLQWREHGGPAVSPPTRQGFGTRLISGAITRFLSAEVQLEYMPNGVTWIMIAPLSALTA